MIICDKFFYKHCEKVFNFKNKLYNHIRNYKLLFIKSIIIYKFNLTQFFIFKKSIISDANIVFKKKKIKFNTLSFFIIKSISYYDFNLLILNFIENFILKFYLLTSLLAYRAVLSLSFIYKFYKKLYFTIANLYIRYILLNKFIITRIIIVLFIIFIKINIKLYYMSVLNKTTK